MMKRVGSVILVCVLFIIATGSVSAQYVQTYFDYKLLQHAEQRIDQLIEAKNKEHVFHMLSFLINNWSIYEEDPQASYIVYQLTIMLEQALQKILEKQFWSMWDDIVIPSLTERMEQAQRDNALNYHEDQHWEQNSDEKSSVYQDGVTEQWESAPQVFEHGEFVDQFTQLSRRQFYEVYFPHMLVDRPLPDRCFTYYDQIDQIAQARNFPTALIIATWHREHTCNFLNPRNGWWNFQITSHHYPPGEITWDDFRYQIDNFIDFKEAKWRRYDAIQVYGPEPVTLAYHQFDLSSIRKSAILYNGVHPDVRLDHSWYANENFTQERWWRNWIVASVLQVLKREYEHWKLD
jgi:hypothetical protein